MTVGINQKTNGGTKFKTSNLMSDLRNNLTNAMEKVIGITCEWIDLASGRSHSEMMQVKSATVR